MLVRLLCKWKEQDLSLCAETEGSLLKRWYSEVDFFTCSSQEAKMCSFNPLLVPCVCSWLSPSRPHLLWPLVLPQLRPVLNGFLSLLGFTCCIQAKRWKIKNEPQKIISITCSDLCSKRKGKLFFKTILLFKTVFKISVIIWNAAAMAILSGGTPGWVGVGAPSSASSCGHHHTEFLWRLDKLRQDTGPFEMQRGFC